MLQLRAYAAAARVLGGNATAAHDAFATQHGALCNNITSGAPFGRFEPTASVERCIGQNTTDFEFFDLLSRVI